MEPPRPEMNVKWDSKTHFKTRFSFFSAFRPRLALKLAKSALYREKKSFLEKFDMGIRKRKIRY
jgi:hypothetical protein